MMFRRHFDLQFQISHILYFLNEWTSHIHYHIDTCSDIGIKCNIAASCGVSYTTSGHIDKSNREIACGRNINCFTGYIDKHIVIVHRCGKGYTTQLAMG